MGKLYREMIIEKDRVIFEEKEKKFEKYRNKIPDLLKTSKQCHYQQFFEANKKSQKFYGKEFTTYILEKKAIKTVLVPCQLREISSKP